MCYGNNTLITGKIIMKKYYLVYKTTNLVNGKIYIGKHETDNLDDGYLGSGKLLKRAIEKYGEENFKREILFECSTREEMNAKEAELVNEEFLKRKDVYNLKQGGQGGFDFINTSSDIKTRANFTKWKKLTQTEKRTLCKKIGASVKQIWIDHPEQYSAACAGKFPLAFKGKHHTEESKQKIGEKNKQLVGKRNGSFGTVWIYNESLEQNKKVKKEEVETFLAQGWKLGRKTKYN